MPRYGVKYLVLCFAYNAVEEADSPEDAVELACEESFDEPLEILEVLPYKVEEVRERELDQDDPHGDPFECVVVPYRADDSDFLKVIHEILDNKE